MLLQKAWYFTGANVSLGEAAKLLKPNPELTIKEKRKGGRKKGGGGKGGGQMHSYSDSGSHWDLGKPIPESDLWFKNKKSPCFLSPEDSLWSTLNLNRSYIKISQSLSLYIHSGTAEPNCVISCSSITEITECSNCQLMPSNGIKRYSSVRRVTITATNHKGRLGALAVSVPQG